MFADRRLKRLGLVLLITVSFMLIGCGAKGDLYLPKQDSEQQ